MEANGKKGVPSLSRSDCLQIILNRSERVTNLIQKKAPAHLVENECRMLFNAIFLAYGPKFMQELTNTITATLLAGYLPAEVARLQDDATAFLGEKK